MKFLFKYIFPAVYGLTVYATVRLLQDTEHGYMLWRRPVSTTLAELTVSIVAGYMLIGTVRFICRDAGTGRLRARSHVAHFKREILKVICATLIIENALLTPFIAFTGDGLSLSDFVCVNTLPLLYTLIYYGIVRSRVYLDAYVREQLAIEKLTNDHLETELKFLKSQYHPHFLFNVLNTIYFQVDEDIRGAKQSIEVLSELLRYQLYERTTQVPFRQELDHLNNYLQLQKLRSSDRLRLTIDFEEAQRERHVYPLLLLPLIENAFKYVGGDYQIDIVVRFIAHDQVLFRVVNSLPEESSPVLINASGIGLENLKRRLELLYPDRHQLSTGKKGKQYIAELSLSI